MDKQTITAKNLTASIKIKQALLEDKETLSKIEFISKIIIDCFKNKGKVLFCGNGGSAADAQHLAAELSGRYYFDRPPLSSEALHVNTSYLTAVANDYSFDEIYSRLLEALGNKGDVLIALSTSGNSANIVKAIEKANQKGMITIGFTGNKKGKMNAICQHLIEVPSDDTPRIQECHMLIGHSICENVEKQLFQHDS
jgi:D-sedoheptulose 7-phosphate isomerase